MAVYGKALGQIAAKIELLKKLVDRLRRLLADLKKTFSATKRVGAPAEPCPLQGQGQQAPPTPQAASPQAGTGSDGQPVAEGMEKGESLGTFKVTAYNIAHESDHPSHPRVPARGLDREYGRAFLVDVIMQGSGVDREGRLIQVDWSKGRPGNAESTWFCYVQQIRGASGRPIEDGVSIAVDPAVIPLGEWVHIEDVGWRRADDTGGRIVGKSIDLFMLVPRSEALTWGRRRLRVWKARRPGD